MPAIALLNDEGDLLGFMLVASEERFAAGMQSDCILTGVPKKAELFDTPLCEVIQSHKNVEYTLIVAGEPPALHVDLGDGWELALSIGDEGRGAWSAQHADGTSLSGQCALAGKPKG